MLDGFLIALHNMTSWYVLLAVVVGIITGYTAGALPGMSSSMGIALLLPFTFGLTPVISIVMLVTLYVATEYSGAIPAILINTPGIPAAAITAIDGYPMRLRGEAGAALTLSILSAAFGSMVSTLLLIVTATSLASIALTFGPVEYFGIAVLGLSLISSLSGKSMLKGFIGLFLGLAAGLIGTDPIDGVTRYVFADGLISGVAFLPALIGLFALSSIFVLIEESAVPIMPLNEIQNVFGQFGLMKPHFWILVRSTLIGYLVSVNSRSRCDNFSDRVVHFSKTDIEDSRNIRNRQSGRRGRLGNWSKRLSRRRPGTDAGLRNSRLPGHGRADWRFDASRRPAWSAAVRQEPRDTVCDFYYYDRHHAIDGRSRTWRRASLGPCDADSKSRDRAACHRAVPARQLCDAE